MRKLELEFEGAAWKGRGVKVEVRSGRVEELGAVVQWSQSRVRAVARICI